MKILSFPTQKLSIKAKEVSWDSNTMKSYLQFKKKYVYSFRRL
ncbi:hypothetical protein AAZX31_08G356600 [Glycine max]